MQIISCLPLAEKYICKSVCKKWFVSVREVLKDQDEIVLSLVKLPENSGMDRKNAMHFVCKRKAVRAAAAAGDIVSSSLTDFWSQHSLSPDYNSNNKVKMLSQLNRLEKIVVAEDIWHSVSGFYGQGVEHETVRKEANRRLFVKIVDSLILSNSQSLVSLNGKIPHIAGCPVIFKKLKELACEKITGQDIAVCPKLEKLTVKDTSLSFVTSPNLPVESLTELNADYGAWASYYWNYDKDDDGNREWHSAVHKLVNLKVLRISGGILIHDLEAGNKKKILQNHRKLEILSLRFANIAVGVESEESDDEFVQHLVETNPNIREIDYLCLTEPGFRSLSRLQNLRTITDLRVSAPDQIVPMLTILLSGNSRHSIQMVSIGLKLSRRNTALVFDVNLQELEPLLRETGLIHRKCLLIKKEFLFSRKPFV
jgi:hypothetical protein